MRASLARAWMPVVCLAAALATVLPAGIDEDHARPMREEDVVRMVVRGVPREEILRAIQSRPAAYDLSTEMLDELRAAAIPPELIEAMVRRKGETEAAAAIQPVERTAAAPAGPALRLVLNPRRKDTPSILRLRGEVDARTREGWQLDAASAGEPFENLALYVICRTAIHVPDHWRSKSPLGRDFSTMPRHAMLAFVAGASRGGSSKPPLIELELPEFLVIELEPGEVHDLSVGLAVQVADRYYRLGDDARDGVIVEDSAETLEVYVDGGQDGELSALGVRFAHP